MNHTSTDSTSTPLPVSRPFQQILRRHDIDLSRMPLEILQVNLTARCNLACHHCHVESGPKRTESLSEPDVARLIELMDSADALTTVDLTGGAPELHPQFRDLVLAGSERGLKVIDRCNLTVLFEPGQEDTAEFLAESGTNVIASLPCYTPDNVDKQRGNGVFVGSIEALHHLNTLGYGRPDSGLVLDLVYNPVGAYLPGSQAQLEADYRQRLEDDFGVVFNSLFTITNMPIKRFLYELEREGELEAYMQLLVENFNPQAALGVMCRNLVSVGWDGSLFDCDFNQMLEIDLGGQRTTIWDIDRLDEINERRIAFAEHCYGCTAGAGSSCGGALAQ